MTDQTDERNPLVEAAKRAEKNRFVPSGKPLKELVADLDQTDERLAREWLGQRARDPVASFGKKWVQELTALIQRVRSDERDKVNIEWTHHKYTKQMLEDARSDERQDAVRIVEDVRTKILTAETKVAQGGVRACDEIIRRLKERE